MRLLLTQVALLACASAASIVLKISPSNVLPNPNALPPSTHATITSPNGAILRSSLRKDNSIVFPEIPSVGSHLLNIYTKDYVFASYRIDTTPNLATTDTTHEDGSSAVLISFAAQLFPGTQWSDTGLSLIPQQQDASSSTGMSTRPQASLTIYPKVLGAKNFYEVRQGFSPLSLLKNPMILLAIVALAFTFGMPKLMENMDPEMKAEYEEMQKKGPTAALGRAMGGGGPATSAGESFDLAGYLAGQKKEGGGAEGVRGKK
ncbi:hypothetical protein OHC33_007907 [Knufia fluminis]|uniref:ER membrane protein complex subunit 7 beta-sandwich domain-containing protein n=1 Tax=Knufia fluminis TaxID=191047 RepID=A0AAN8I456_9EURO|nr:hypothetical protein OHC33_007907 [Knufia fluminis]